ncbi:MAG: saccharopine dehydrogenase C-terminal domain-containing protein [Flavobacteriales bacterium]
MKTILLFGAGRSATALIDYLLEHCESLGTQLLIVDRDISSVAEKMQKHPFGAAKILDISDKDARQTLVGTAEVVVSMLPARFHHIIAEDCLLFSKSLFTASYLSKELKAMDEEAKAKGLLFLNEIGLDPGIDHMSAKQVIDDVHEKGGKFLSFKSFCGGLIAEESDDNPWNYKFTWNPRNVVLAGSSGVAQFLEKGQYKYLPYHQLYSRLQHLKIPNFGKFEAYPNRDSLSYRKPYNLEYLETIYRGTVRKTGYCKNWNAFVQLGMTDDTYQMKDSKGMTCRAFTNSFLPYGKQHTVEEKFQHYTGIEDLDRFEWLGLFSDEVLPRDTGTPAQILQAILEPKWALKEDDKDLIVMQHQFEYQLNGKTYLHKSSFGIEGKDAQITGMAMTVGYPIAMAVKLYLQGKLKRTGVHIPIHKTIYEPILEELKTKHIQFSEDITEL